MLCKSIHFQAVREPYIIPSGFLGCHAGVNSGVCFFLISMLDLFFSANVSRGKAVDKYKA